MPTIEFRTYDEESYANFRPIAARDYQPEWWKKMKVRIDHRGRLTQTIRSCPAMQDWLTMGYYIVATRDIPVRNGVEWSWPDGSHEMQVDENTFEVSQSHPSAQLADTIQYITGDSPVKDAFKLSSHWNMKTPEGYSVLFIDPFLFQNKYFAVWQGVIDTDKFNVGADNGQIIFYPRVDHSFIIPSGTPILQVVPFQREEWASTYFYGESKDWFNEHAITDASMQKWQRDLKLVDEETGLPNARLNIGGYRQAKIWNPKNKFFQHMKEGESPPPECPMHEKDENQLEMDFVEKQRSQTDLNWDGSESSENIDRD